MSFRTNYSFRSSYLDIDECAISGALEALKNRASENLASGNRASPFRSSDVASSDVGAAIQLNSLEMQLLKSASLGKKSIGKRYRIAFSPPGGTFPKKKSRFLLIQ